MDQHEGHEVGKYCNILQGMIYKNGFPSTVVIHCGGNDFGDIPCGLLLHQLGLTFATLIELIPGVPIIWSCILPRIPFVFHNVLRRESKP